MALDHTFNFRSGSVFRTVADKESYQNGVTVSVEVTVKDSERPLSFRIQAMTSVTLFPKPRRVWTTIAEGEVALDTDPLRASYQVAGLPNNHQERNIRVVAQRAPEERSPLFHVVSGRA